MIQTNNNTTNTSPESIIHSFNKHDYDNCLNQVNELFKLNPSDFRIQHNLVILDKYYNIENIKDSDTENIVKELERLRTNAEKTGKHRRDLSSGLTKGLEILQYNQAVIYFKLSRYGESFQLLHSLFLSIDALDEFVALRVCFLMLDLMLDFKQLSHNAIFPTHDTSQQSNSNEPLNIVKDSPDSVLIPNRSRYLSRVMDHTLRLSEYLKKNRINDELTTARHVCMSTTTRLSTCVSVYEARAALFENQTQKAFLIVSDAIDNKCTDTAQTIFSINNNDNNDINTDENKLDASCITIDNINEISMMFSLLMLLAFIECRRSNYSRAIQTLSDSLSAIEGVKPQFQTGNEVRLWFERAEVMCHNNLAVVYMQTNNFGIASYHLHRGLEYNTICFDQSMKSKFIDIEDDASPKLSYNAGLQNLQMGNYSRAFWFFRKCIFARYNDPLLWMRIAECCVQEHNNKVEEGWREKINCVMEVSDPASGIEYGLSRVRLPKTVPAPKGLPQSAPVNFKGVFSSMMNGSQRYGVHSGNSGTSSGSSSHSNMFIQLQPFDSEMSLGLADIALKNALCLLNKERSKSSTTSSIYIQCLINWTYVSLCLHHSANASRAAKQLIRNPQVNINTKMLAIAYLCESLWIHGASKSQSPLEVISESDLEHVLRFGNDVNLKDSVFANLAVWYIKQGDHVKAEECLSHYVKRDTPKIVLIRLYLLLIQGKQQIATQYLRSQTVIPVHVINV